MIELVSYLGIAILALLSITMLVAAIEKGFLIIKNFQAKQEFNKNRKKFKVEIQPNDNNKDQTFELKK